MKTQIHPDLHSIEKQLAGLWTRKDLRSQFLAQEEDLRGSIDKRGVKLYASLIRLGRQDLMKSIYPGCARLLSRNWPAVVDRYMETRPPDHFNLNRAASAFSEFLRVDAPDLIIRHPFLPELADYEWVELEIIESDRIAVSADACAVSLSDPDTIQAFGPVLNPVMDIRHYQYPVLKVVDWLREDLRLPRRLKKDPIHVAIYRDPDELSARFLELGPLCARILDAVRTGPSSYADLIGLAVTESGSRNPTDTVIKALTLFEELLSLKLFLGSKKVR